MAKAKKRQTKACLVDYVDGACVVPWMTFPTLREAVEARRTSCSSWPYLVCEFDADPVRQVPTRHARNARKGDHDYGRTELAYRPITVPVPFYDAFIGAQT
jgi:hypothetical protein